MSKQSCVTLQFGTSLVGQNLDSGAGFNSCFTSKLPSSDDHEISIMVILSCSCTTRSSLGDSLQNHKGRELSRSRLL